MSEKVKKEDLFHSCKLKWDDNGSIVVECPTSEAVVKATEVINEKGVHIQHVKVASEKVAK